MDFKTMSIEDIIAWCQKHNEVAWLKEEAKKTVPCKVYPRKSVIKTVKDKDGNLVEKTTSVADHDAEPTIENRPITFVQLKTEFCRKFMPEIMKGKKKPTMFDLIANL